MIDIVVVCEGRSGGVVEVALLDGLESLAASLASVGIEAELRVAAQGMDVFAAQVHEKVHDPLIVCEDFAEPLSFHFELAYFV